MSRKTGFQRERSTLVSGPMKYQYMVSLTERLSLHLHIHHYTIARKILKSGISSELVYVLFVIDKLGNIVT